MGNNNIREELIDFNSNQNILHKKDRRVRISPDYAHPNETIIYRNIRKTQCH